MAILRKFHPRNFGLIKLFRLLLCFGLFRYLWLNLWWIREKNLDLPSSSQPPHETSTPITFLSLRQKLNQTDIHPYVPPDRLEKGYKNPCWFETHELEDPYLNNPFYHIPWEFKMKKMFDRLRDNWRRRFEGRERGNHHLPSPRRFRCMPYFYLLGMEKSGSTDMYQMITTHPEVDEGPDKETHWLSFRRFGFLHHILFSSFRPATFAHYLDLYDEAAQNIIKDPKKIVGDGSPTYLFDNEGWLNYLNWRLTNGTLPPLISSHLARLNPKAKLIIMLREPVARMYSAYKYFPYHIRKIKKSVPHFHRFVSAGIKRFENCLRSWSLEACVRAPELNSAARGEQISVSRVRLGIYHVFIRDWLNQFPRNQILVIRLEDYVANKMAALERVRQFLNLESPFNRKAVEDAKLVYKSRTPIGPMSKKTEDLLRRFYAPHNEALAKLLKDDKFLWKDVWEKKMLKKN